MQSFVEMRFIRDSPIPCFAGDRFAAPFRLPRYFFYLFMSICRDQGTGQAKCALDYRKLAWLNSVDALLRLDEPTYTVVRTQSGGHDNKYGIVKSRQIGLSFGLKAR